MPSRLTVVLVSLLLATPAVVSWLWLVIVPLRVTKLCPAECCCDVGGYFVNCSNTSLHNIPSIKLTHVQELILNDNNITSLEKDIFVSKGLIQLDFLALDRCGLQTIELGAFNGLTKLTVLSMRENGIGEITEHTFENMSGLKYLDLQYNRIEHLDVDVFWGLVNLQRINLEGNELLKIHPDILVGLPKLEHLDLSANGGLQIPTDSYFINSHSLKILNISDCNVSSVSVETFANVSTLETLDLRYNKLRSIDIKILRSLSKLSALYLNGNPLQCDFQLKEVWGWCQEHNIATAYTAGIPEFYTLFEIKVNCYLEFEEHQCIQDNISNKFEYKQKNNTHPDEEYEQRYNIIVHVLVPLIIILSIFCTTGNVFILIIILCNKDMRKVPNMYILNLTISDMILLTSGITFAIEMISSEFRCVFLVYVYRMSIDLSAYSVVVLSIQRYIITVNSFHVRASSKPKWRVAVATIFGVWILAALSAIPTTSLKVFCFDPIMLRKNIAYYKLVVAFELLVSCVYPLCLIAFSYIMTVRYLVKSSCPIYEETKIPQMNTRKNVAKIVVGLTVVFLISYAPFHIIWAYIIFNIDCNFNMDIVLAFGNGNKNIFLILPIATLLLLINSCLNPVAIFCTSSLFRKQLKLYLTCFGKTNSPPTNIQLTRRN